MPYKRKVSDTIHNVMRNFCYLSSSQKRISHMDNSITVLLCENGRDILYSNILTLLPLSYHLI
jgi:hypothetical protein